ncbi:flagellar biosynthesis anti-sigma factor FlgM [Desulfosarcina sp.]|uniref:flagellar biosynthesis anti-sigma factor FlgM n=1 Tax=Desulfosarcina sp. TaxID=2027861 RepID=UPI00356394A8
MEIPEKGPTQALPAQNRSLEKVTRTPIETNGAQRNAEEKDTVSLTERGRAFKAAADHAHSLPEIREDRVMELKRKLEEGTYRVSGHRIAVNMINESLENNQVLEHIDTKA